MRTFALLATTGGVVVAVLGVLSRPATIAIPLGIVVIILVRPLIARLAREAAWALPLSVAMALLLVDLNGAASGTGDLNYVVMLIVVATALAVSERRTSHRMSALWWVTAAFIAYGTVGTVVGRLVSDTTNGAFPIVIPLVIVLIAPFARRSTDDAEISLKLLSVLGSAFGVLSILTRSGVFPGATFTYSHEKAFVLVLAIGAALAVRSKLLLVVSVISSGMAFAAYPAASYPVAAGAALVTLLIVRIRPGAIGRHVIGALAAITATAAILNIDKLIDISAEYFALIGKVNNGSTRSDLYDLALRSLEGREFFATYFTGPLTVVTNLSGRDGTVIPVHNDFLGIAVSGGIAGSALFALIFLLANGMALRATSQMAAGPERAALVVLLCTVNAATVTAFANPVFMNPQSSALVFCTLAALITLCQRPLDAAKPEGGLAGIGSRSLVRRGA